MTALAPRDYVELPEMPRDWLVADVGPGNYPLKRADIFVDWQTDILAPLKAEGRETILTNFEIGLPEIRDKQFDFVWCSHVLEHVYDPAACAATLSRIGRSGVIVMPSAVKESLFDFEEPDHKWLVLPHPQDGPPVFVRQNKKFINALIDIDVQKITCRLFRHGTAMRLPDDDYLLDWFRTREAFLDVVYFWSGELKLTVIG